MFIFVNRLISPIDYEAKDIPNLIRVVILISLMLGSITLSACLGSTIETVENKKSIHEQRQEKMHQDAHRAKRYY